MTSLPVEVRLSVPVRCECAACGSDLSSMADWGDGEAIIVIQPCRVCLQAAARVAAERAAEVHAEAWEDGG